MTGGGDRPPAASLKGLLSGVRGRLVALVVAAAIPAAGIAAANAWAAYEATLSQRLRDAAILREVASARHGAAVGALRDMLEGVARFTHLPDLSRGACDAELARLRSLKPERYSNFWLLDADGMLTCSGLAAGGRRSSADLDYVRQVQATRRFAVGEFTIGTISGHEVLPAAAPMIAPDGSLRAIVGGGLRLDYLLRDGQAPEDAGVQHVWLLDREGTVLPLGDAPEGFLPRPELLSVMLAAGRATRRGIARDGASYAWSIDQLSPGLELLVGVPMEQTEAAAQRALAQRLVEFAIFLGACILAVLLGVEFGVSRPLRRLAARVRRWAPGRVFEAGAQAGGPREVHDLDNALRAAAEALQERDAALTGALRQRDLLMAEIHHRVKNNLQVVASLLSLQADRLRTPGARAEFAVARDRVQALATLHRHLYLHQSFERISLRAFLEELSRQLGDAMGAGAEDRISIVIEADDVEMGSDQAISLALLLTETVSNAIRHAFPDGREGTIRITFRTEGDEAFLVVHDDGVGLREASSAGGDGLGLQLIEGFAAHLGGEAVVTVEDGTCISVRFPLQLRQAEEAPRGAGTPGGA